MNIKKVHNEKNIKQEDIATVIDALEIALFYCNAELMTQLSVVCDSNYEEMVLKTEKIQELFERLSN